MNLIKEESITQETVINIAKKMLIAAKTAPKGRGIDNTVLGLAESYEIKIISDKMLEIGEKNNFQAFKRDALNILSSPVMLLLGSKINSMGLAVCGMCGFKNCEEKNNHPNIPCVFNPGDLGIAIGSAVSIAMDHRVDNRIMYTVGQAVIELNIFEKDVKIVYGIPLSATAKNPFFDRK